jgi:hypothetical protein
MYSNYKLKKYKYSRYSILEDLIYILEARWKTFGIFYHFLDKN